MYSVVSPFHRFIVRAFQHSIVLPFERFAFRLFYFSIISPINPFIFRWFRWSLLEHSRCAIWRHNSVTCDGPAVLLYFVDRCCGGREKRHHAVTCTEHVRKFVAALWRISDGVALVTELPSLIQNIYVNLWLCCGAVVTEVPSLIQNICGNLWRCCGAIGDKVAVTYTGNLQNFVTLLWRP